MDKSHNRKLDFQIIWLEFEQIFRKTGEMPPKTKEEAALKAKMEKNKKKPLFNMGMLPEKYCKWAQCTSQRKADLDSRLLQCFVTFTALCVTFTAQIMSRFPILSHKKTPIAFQCPQT